MYFVTVAECNTCCYRVILRGLANCCKVVSIVRDSLCEWMSLVALSAVELENTFVPIGNIRLMKVVG